MNKFTPLSAAPIYQESREIGVSPRTSVLVDFESISVLCDSCGFTWTAVRGEPRDGDFSGGVCGLNIGCPECDAEGVLNGSAVLAVVGD